MNSGVLKTLTDLPYYNDYVPDQYQYKEGLLYDFYGRPTLAYSPECAYLISDAILVLSEMSDNLNDTSTLNLSIWTLAVIMTGLLTIYAFVWTFCDVKQIRARDACCG